MNFVTYQKLASDVMKLVPFCVKHDVSSIYGVPRSGMLPATMLATALQLPLGVPGEGPVIGRRVGARPRDGRGPALLIDDSVNNGASLQKASRAMRVEHLTACVYSARPGAPVDVYAEMLAPRLFEWNVFNCDRVPQFMFDMDGVFCQDPEPFDDDGPDYADAIRLARPKYLTKWPVGWIVTNRIERWRAITEAWLDLHGIRVQNELVMQQYPTADERRNKSDAASYKAQHYADSNAELFVESSDDQARRIHEASGKPVLSVSNMVLYQ